MTHRILIVDDEESIRFTFTEFLASSGYQVNEAESTSQAIALLETELYDVVFLDILLGRDSGIDVLRRSKELNPNCPVIMVTGAPEINTAADSIRLSAYDYLVKPVGQDELVRHAQRAIAFKEAIDEKERYQQRMSAVFQGVREGILTFDSSMQLIDMNFAATKILGMNNDVLGQDLKRLAQKTKSKVLNALQELLESRFEGELYKLSFERSTGEPLILSVSMSPLQSAAGQDHDLVMVLRDETGPIKEVSL